MSADSPAETFVTALDDTADIEEPEPATSPAISAYTFDCTNPQPITDKATLEAMDRLGISYKELEMPSDADVDPNLRDIFNDHHRGRIDRLLRQIRASLQTSPRSRTTAVSQASPPPARVASASSSRALEATERRHQRQIESLVERVIEAEELRADAAMKEERAAQLKSEIARKRADESEAARVRREQRVTAREAAERDIRRSREARREEEIAREEKCYAAVIAAQKAKVEKLQEAEAARQARAGQNRDGIAQVAAEKVKKMDARRVRDEENVRARESKLREDQTRRVNRNSEARAHKESVLGSLGKAKEEQLAERRKKLEKQNEDFETRYEALIADRTAASQQAALKHDERRSRTAHIREEEERMRFARRTAGLTDPDVLEGRISALEMEKEKARKRRVFLEKLKKEERDQNAAHIEHQRERQRAEMRRKQEADEERIARFEQQKEKEFEERRAHTERLERKRADLDAALRQQIASHQGEAAILVLAQQYGIDVERIRERVGSARSRSRSPE
jgi:hypothetical protein